MPANLSPPPSTPAPGTLNAEILEVLRRLAVECAQEVDAPAVVAALRRSIVHLDGAGVLEVNLPGVEAEEGGALAALSERARREERTVGAGDDAEEPAPAGTLRAVAVPMRIHGEPAALALGWSRRDPGAERARVLTEALAEQASVALCAAARHTELRDAALRRDRFFSAMSHDLRTPITAIVGYSELLQDGIVGALTERQQEMVERICQVSGELSQLVTDMLDLAKLDAGRMEFHEEPAALEELVHAALEGAEPHLEGNGVRVEVAPCDAGEAPLQVDRARVRQVLANLVAHAARAVPGGVVRVTAGCEPGSVWVEVADGGAALPPGSEEALFDTAPHGGARTGRVGPGAALSLALSRRIARAMGGEVEARGLPGGGMALTLRLPQGTPAPRG